MERCSSGGILSSLLSRSGDTEGANNQTVVNTKTTDANINKTVKAAPDDVVLVRARKSSQERFMSNYPNNDNFFWKKMRAQ